MNERFKEIVSKILLIEKEQVVPELHQDDVEDWDSMTHLVLISDIEQEYNVSFSDEEVVEAVTIQDLLNLLSNRNIVLQSS